MDKNIKKIISPIEPNLLDFEQKFKRLIEAQNLYLKNDLELFLFNNSKRLRVIFVYIISKILKTEKDISNILLALELIHNASLLHDDVLDEEEKRRDNLTFYKKYNSKLAILEGDILLSLALEMLSSEKKEIVSIFAKRIYKTINAEINQYETKNKILSEEEYFKKTFNKTGNLFLVGVEALFEKIETDLETKKSLISLVENFSLAFQIKNDIDNFKKDCSDFKNGNYTLPVIYYFKENSNEDIDFNSDKFKKYLSMAQNKVTEIKDFAIEKLEKIENSIYKNMLKELIEETLRS